MPRRFAICVFGFAVLAGWAVLMFPAQAKTASFVTSDGVRLSYRERGSGTPALVFVPGWTMPGSIWSPQLDHFSARHRTIVFYPRGQGGSDIPAEGYTPERRAQDIAELIDAAGADQPV